MNKLLFKCTILCSLSFYSWAGVEFIPLYNRSTDDVLPTISTVYPNIPITSYGNQLVVNGSPEEIRQIQELVSQLDTPARRLLITVDSSGDSQYNDNSYSSRGSIQLGGKTSAHTRIKANQTNTISNSSNLKQIMTNEGSPTLLQVGQSIPVTTQTRDRYGRYQQTTHYQEAIQSLYVTVQISGQQVYITLNDQNNTFSPNSAIINQQTINTRVSGTLGSWITIGALQDNTTNNSQGYTHYSQSSGYSNNNIRIKVDLAD